MVKPTFETFIAEERERLQKAKEDLLSKRQEVDEQLTAADRELQAIAAYEQAKQGKFPFREPRTRKPKDSAGPRAPRGSREQLKSRIVELVKQHPTGLTSRQITDALDSTVAKQLPNLLSLMKKEGALAQEGRGGPYSIPLG
jgi:hypothetical protein